MSEMGGLDVGMPDEGQGGASEGLSEQAKQRFAGAQAALQQLKKEERKAKKRDEGVASVILQFLTDAQRAHLATLIARLVAMDCPSPFLLSVLSLISDPCKAAVDEYLQEQGRRSEDAESEHAVIPTGGSLDIAGNEALVAWIRRMEHVLRIDHHEALTVLLVDDNNIDGTILQLTTFVLEEFLSLREKQGAFEQLQTLSIGILQSLFEPYLVAHLERKALLEAEKKANEDHDS